MILSHINQVLISCKSSYEKTFGRVGGTSHVHSLTFADICSQGVDEDKDDYEKTIT